MLHIGAYEYNAALTIKDNHNLNGVKVFPNPAYNMFYVNINTKKHNNYALKLFDFQGILVRNLVITNKEIDLINFSAKDLNSGVYFLKILIDNRITINKKIKIK